MKKKSIIAVGIATGVIFLAMVIASLYFTLPFVVWKTTESGITYDKENEIIYANDTLDILQITDLHVNGAVDMPLTFSIIKRLVYRDTPDMIVITGDIFSSGASKGDVDKLITFMEKLKLPWACVLGNHDDETPYSLEELSSLLENADYSLFKRGNLTDRYGNYAYDVRFENGKNTQLIFMDTRSDGFTEESVEFYKSTVIASSERNGGKVMDNLLFYHIPLGELNEAVKAVGDGGKIREEICNQSNEVGFFDAVLELGATKAMIYGHDHINNAKINYKGVDFNYGLKSSTSSYNGTRLVGGTLYSLTPNGYEFDDRYFLRAD